MTTEVKAHSTRNIPLAKIVPNPYQPREGDSDTLDELAESIRAQGLLQPIAVRGPLTVGKSKKPVYECVFGHRRIAAALKLGWKEISAVILDVSPQEAADRLLEENLRRDDLTATDKARFLQKYMADFGETQTQVGERFGMAQETVSNYLRILNVPDEVQALVDEGRLTGSHVKELLPLSDHPQAMIKRALASAAPKGKGADQAVSVRTVAERVGWDKTDEDRKDHDKRRKIAAKTTKGPALAKRLLAGLTATEDKRVPYVDPESGLPLLFGRAKVGGVLLAPVKPAFIQKDYNPQSDPELVKALDKLGVKLGYGNDGPHLIYNEQSQNVYHLSTALRKKTGTGYKGPCPCGGEHVAVRGWGVEKGDPIKDNYAWGDTETKGAPKTVIYCTNPLAVNIALAGPVLKEFESKQEKERQEKLTLEAFLKDVAPLGGAPVAAFLIGCSTGDLAPVEKALTYPGEAWAALCERYADDYTDWRGRNTGNPGIQRLVAVATGQAKAAEPKEKKARKKKAAGAK